MKTFHLHSSYVHGNHGSIFNLRKNVDESLSIRLKHEKSLNLSSLKIEYRFEKFHQLCPRNEFIACLFLPIISWAMTNTAKRFLHSKLHFYSEIQNNFTFNWIFMRFASEWSANRIFPCKQNSYWRSEMTRMLG